MDSENKDSLRSVLCPTKGSTTTESKSGSYRPGCGLSRPLGCSFESYVDPQVDPDEPHRSGVLPYRASQAGGLVMRRGSSHLFTRPTGMWLMHKKRRRTA